MVVSGVRVLCTCTASTPRRAKAGGRKRPVWYASTRATIGRPLPVMSPSCQRVAYFGNIWHSGVGARGPAWRRWPPARRDPDPVLRAGRGAGLQQRVLRDRGRPGAWSGRVHLQRGHVGVDGVRRGGRSADRPLGGQERGGVVRPGRGARG